MSEKLFTWKIVHDNDKVFTHVLETSFAALPDGGRCFDEDSIKTLNAIYNLSAIPDLTCLSTPIDKAMALQKLEKEVLSQYDNVKNKKEQVDHPAHYGGKDNPYEAIKVIRAWALEFCLANTVKYIARAGKKDATIQDLKKARWYLDYRIKELEEEEKRCTS